MKSISTTLKKILQPKKSGKKSNGDLETRNVVDDIVRKPSTRKQSSNENIQSTDKSRITEYESKEAPIRRQSVLLPEPPISTTNTVQETPTSTSSGPKESNMFSSEETQTPLSSEEEEEEYYSEDAEEADDQVGRLESDPALSRPGLGSRNASHASRRSRLDAEDASSIIGGRSVDQQSLNHSEAEHRDPAESPENQEQKIFSFSLPFNNPLANFELRNLTSRTFSLFRGEDEETSPYSDPYQLASINSHQEELLYQKIHDQDNTRLRAVKHAFTPNISIDSLNPLTPPKPDGFPQIDGDVIILGGYRGSILRDVQTKRRVWIPIRVGLNIRKIDLSVGLRDKDEHEMGKYIYPDGMLTHIGPVDVSRKLIRKLSAQPKCNVHEFAYDWRLSPAISSAKLVKLIKSLHEKNRNNPDYKGPIIIAHSMGGLIAHHAMQFNAELVRGILYAGSPSSCPNILGPLRYGDSVLLSSRVLTAQVNFLMRSSFVFLPLNGRCFVDRSDSSRRYDLDFFDVKTWIEYGFSPCVNKSLEVRRTQTKSQPVSLEQRAPLPASDTIEPSTSPHVRKRSDTFNSPNPELIPFEDAVEYLDRTLKRTKKFLEDLQYDETKASKYPPLAVLYGYGVPTLRGARVNGFQGIKDGDYSDLVFGAGDGVVYQKSLMPVDIGYDVVAKVPSERGHVSLLNDIDGVGKALKAILDEEQNRAFT